MKEQKTEPKPVKIRAEEYCMVDCELRKEIATLKAEVERLNGDGVTEEMLRRNGGCIKVGTGCEIAIDGTTAKLDTAMDVIKYIHERLITINCILADENIDRMIGQIEGRCPWFTPHDEGKEG